MKKQCSIALVTVAGMLIGLGGPVPVRGSEIVATVPGNTVVQDPEGDLQLRNCDFGSPTVPCSLPPSAPLDLPGYFDIKTAKITEIGGGWVNLFITLYEPIPETPPYGFVAYIWQFQNGCIEPSPTDKDGVQVVWNGIAQEWHANLFVITSCSPRTIVIGDPVSFQFTEDGVKVQVSLSDLLTSPGEPLRWYAAVRRVPFIFLPFTNTVPVDFAPDVSEFNPVPPPFIIHPEDPATWVPR